MNSPVETMLTHHLRARGVSNPLVLDAMARVPREQFVPGELRKFAYDDRPLPIGHGQTVSQPYIVATMVQLAHVTPDSDVLDIGTGCGYMAAVLATIARRVCTLERIAELAADAEENIRALGIANIDARVGDASHGWPEDRQFDAILVSCAPERVPEMLLAQFKPRGRMVIPLGRSGSHQMLTSCTKNTDGSIGKTEHIPVRFVPMV